jgi:PAS domain S-box-containing protein
MNFFKILLNKILQSPLKFTAKEVMLPAKHKLREVGFLQNAVFNSANFFSIVTDVNGVIQIFSIGAEKSLGYSATEVIGKMTAANLSSTRNLTLLANVLSLEFETVIAPGFEAMVFKATRGIKNIYKLTYIRKDGSHFPVMISVTALRDNNQAITGYLLISTDDIRQKLAKRVLRKATVWQNVIFNSANFPIIATDVDGIIQVFNIGAEQTLGYSATEVIDKMTLVDLSDASGLIRRADSLSMEFEEQIAPNFKAMIFKAALGIEDIYELTYICKDDNPFSVQVSVTALYADDSIIGYLLIGTNNAARKAAKRKARKTDTLQNAIFNSINFSSIATDVNGVIQIFNVGAEHMLGYSAAEVVNTMTPADLSDTEELILRAKALSLEFGAVINSDFESLIFKASRGIEDIYELTYIRKDGSRFPAMVSVTALRDKDGIIGYLLIGTDNTARKKAEDGICIAAVAFEAAQGMFITDSIGSLIHVNPAFLEITGYTTAELIGNNPRILKSDKHSSEFYTSMWQSINTDGKWLGEIWNRKKNDELYLAQLSIVKVVNTQGITTNYVATLVDITQRKQYETDLILAKERAEHFFLH